MADDSSTAMGLVNMGGPKVPKINAFRELSPYLPNVDPGYLQGADAPEFIINDDTQTGLFEKSFTAIGSSLFVGGIAGSTYGFFGHLKQAGPSGLLGLLSWKKGPARTELLNHTLKSGNAAFLMH